MFGLFRVTFDYYGDCGSLCVDVEKLVCVSESIVKLEDYYWRDRDGEETLPLSQGNDADLDLENEVPHYKIIPLKVV